MAGWKIKIRNFQYLLPPEKKKNKHHSFDEPNQVLKIDKIWDKRWKDV